LDDSESAVSELNRVAGDVGARRGGEHGENAPIVVNQVKNKSNIRTGVNSLANNLVVAHRSERRRWEISER
jgi:hypothetical protein